MGDPLQYVRHVLLALAQGGFAGVSPDIGYVPAAHAGDAVAAPPIPRELFPSSGRFPHHAFGDDGPVIGVFWRGEACSSERARQGTPASCGRPAPPAAATLVPSCSAHRKPVTSSLREDTCSKRSGDIDDTHSGALGAAGSGPGRTSKVPPGAEVALRAPDEVQWPLELGCCSEASDLLRAEQLRARGIRLRYSLEEAIIIGKKYCAADVTLLCDESLAREAFAEGSSQRSQEQRRARTTRGRSAQATGGSARPCARDQDTSSSVRGLCETHLTRSERGPDTPGGATAAAAAATCAAADRDAAAFVRGAEETLQFVRSLQEDALALLARAEEEAMHGGMDEIVGIDEEEDVSFVAADAGCTRVGVDCGAALDEAVLPGELLRSLSVSEAGTLCVLRGESVVLERMGSSIRISAFELVGHVEDERTKNALGAFGAVQASSAGAGSDVQPVVAVALVSRWEEFDEYHESVRACMEDMECVVFAIDRARAGAGIADVRVYSVPAWRELDVYCRSLTET